MGNFPSQKNLNDRKAIYRHFPQVIPSAFAVDKLGTSPCKAACPAHISVQGYIALITAGKYRESPQIIKKDNPLPAVCGRSTLITNLSVIVKSFHVQEVLDFYT